MGEQAPVPDDLRSRRHMGEFKVLLTKTNPGSRNTWDQLFSELYTELRRLAHWRLRKHSTGTMLDTTVLVHESYLRFLKCREIQIGGRSHFLAYASRVMRSLVIDALRERSSHATLEDEHSSRVQARYAQIGGSGATRLNDALQELAAVDDRLARVVKMRYFGGMTEREVAQALGVTERTVRRDWQKARVLLALTIRGDLPRTDVR